MATGGDPQLDDPARTGHEHQQDGQDGREQQRDA
jgi:hypothetical protein